VPAVPSRSSHEGLLVCVARHRRKQACAQRAAAVARHRPPGTVVWRLRNAGSARVACLVRMRTGMQRLQRLPPPPPQRLTVRAADACCRSRCDILFRASHRTSSPPLLPPCGVLSAASSKRAASLVPASTSGSTRTFGFAMGRFVDSLFRLAHGQGLMR
jgi:hypothetical protein